MIDGTETNNALETGTGTGTGTVTAITETGVILAETATDHLEMVLPLLPLQNHQSRRKSQDQVVHPRAASNSSKLPWLLSV